MPLILGLLFCFVRSVGNLQSHLLVKYAINGFDYLIFLSMSRVTQIEICRGIV